MGAKRKIQVGDLRPRVQELARSVQLESVRLERCSCEFLGLVAGDVPNRLQAGLFAGAGVSPDSPARVRVLVEFDGQVSPTGKEDRPVAHVKAAYSAEYSVANAALIPTLDADDYKQFAGLNGVVNVWPYLRELVHSLSGRMLIPPVTLPSFRPGMVQEVAPPASIQDTPAPRQSAARVPAAVPAARK